jgi:methyl-accepting chemotaxis protein
MTVGACLLMNFLLVTLVGAIMACAGIVDMGRLNEQAERAYKMDLMGISHIKDANIALAYTGRELRSMLLARDDASRDAMRAAVAQRRQEIHAALERARPLFYSNEGKALLAAVDVSLAAYEAAVDETLGKAAAGTEEARQDAIRHMFGAMAPRGEVVSAELDELGELKAASAAQYAKTAWEHYRSGRTVMLALAAVALLSGVALGVLLMRGRARGQGADPGGESGGADGGVTDIEVYQPGTRISWL